MLSQTIVKMKYIQCIFCIQITGQKQASSSSSSAVDPRTPTAFQGKSHQTVNTQHFQGLRAGPLKIRSRFGHSLISNNAWKQLRIFSSSRQFFIIQSLKAGWILMLRDLVLMLSASYAMFILILVLTLVLMIVVMIRIAFFHQS